MMRMAVIGWHVQEGYAPGKVTRSSGTTLKRIQQTASITPEMARQMGEEHFATVIENEKDFDFDFITLDEQHYSVDSGWDHFWTHQRHDCKRNVEQ
jgi:hypothetical protein